MVILILAQAFMDVSERPAHQDYAQRQAYEQSGRAVKPVELIHQEPEPAEEQNGPHH